MNRNFSYLLSPLTIGNTVLKNRMLGAQGLPHFLQGPETWPADTLITHVSNIARAGAAIVTFSTWSDTDQRRSFTEDGKRFPFFDYTDPSTQNYLCQLADAVHFYDSKLSVNIMPIELPNFQPLVDPTMSTPFELLFGVGSAKNVTRDMMDRMIEEAVTKCRLYQSLGFDMVSLHMGWKDFGTHIGLAKFLSPISNDREDEYGGDVSERARFPLEMCRAIKQVCGTDFLIDTQIVGCEEEPGGTTVEDSIQFAKLAEGLVDILQIRASNHLLCHPTAFNSTPEHPVTLDTAQAIKASGTKITIAPVGGYDDPALSDRLIAEGRVDMVSLSRAFISDPEYGKKLLENRADEIVPCIRCAKCHVPSLSGSWLFMCSVNPKAGFEQKIDRMIEPAATKRRVAVIGGGPAGMEAAIVAAKRGHDVTLYERGSTLGGQLRYAEIPSFKWTIRRFKEYLIRELTRVGVTVRLNTEATPEDITSKGYDAVIAATGADPALPPISIRENTHVYTPLDAFEHPDQLGKHVVFVGGSETAIETALHMVSLGHRVTVITRQAALASKAVPFHYRDILEDLWKRTDGFSYILEADTTYVSSEGVCYTDADGTERFVKADSVVLCGGVTPRRAEALRFYGSADQFYMVGDCRDKEGNIQKCMRTAFSAASRI